MHQYVCLDCGRFFEGDERRRLKNKCEECEAEQEEPDKRFRHM
jgi:DNA-directed RNA polymerase subunit RPC12/RpoP